MYTIPLQLSDVIYNAANQTFEALVTVHDQSGTRRYACAISAPINMEFEDAAKGLSTQAMRQHERGDLGSVIKFTRARAKTKSAHVSQTPHEHAHAA